MTTNRVSGVYEILNTNNGKRYVGSAVSIRSRWNDHRMHLRRGSHHSSVLQSAWIKYGEGAFEFRRILICERDHLLLYEQLAINSIRPQYNILQIAGSSIGRKATPETKAKISAKAIGRKRSVESIAKGSATRTGAKLTPEHAAKLIGNQHAKGHRHTDEWKAAASIRLTGMKRPKSPEYRAKTAASLKGRKASPEHRANQAAAQLGKKRGPYRPMSPETLERRIALRRLKPNLLLGRKRSTETIQRMAAALRGRALSNEHRQKISAGNLAMWSDPAKRERIVQRQRESGAMRRKNK